MGEEDRLLTSSASASDPLCVTSDVCGNNGDDPSHIIDKNEADSAISNSKPGVSSDASDNLTNASNNVSCELLNLNLEEQNSTMEPLQIKKLRYEYVIMAFILSVSVLMRSFKLVP